MAAPHLTSLDMRLAALYIRKTRYIKKQDEYRIHVTDYEIERYLETA